MPLDLKDYKPLAWGRGAGCVGVWSVVAWIAVVAVGYAVVLGAFRWGGP